MPPAVFERRPTTWNRTSPSGRWSASALSFTRGILSRFRRSQLFQLCGDAVEPRVDAVDVGVAWYAQTPQCAFDRLVRPLLEVLAPALHLAPQVGPHVEGLANVIEESLTALGDDLAARIDQARRSTLLLRK